MYSLIAAVDNKFGISKNGTIPWDCPEDMHYFKETTMGHVVIMGRVTWESIPVKYRPLSGRINVVLTRSNIVTDDKPDHIFQSVDDCMTFFSDVTLRKPYKDMLKFVIGGASVYKQFIQRNLVSSVYLTHINQDYLCDQHMCDIRNMVDLCVIKKSSNPVISYHRYTIANYEESNYLSLMKYILEHGEKRCDRTGTGTLSVFSRELRFDLSSGHIPMTTTRPLSLRIIFEELMWILRGQTDNKILNKKKIHIWDDNTSREFLDNKKLTYAEGDIGPSYGFQMAHFGAKYNGADKDYTDQGFNQINSVIDQLINNPTSRRILISLWNPTQLSEMALPPCVYGYQFYVASGKLSCKIIQRSSDIALAGAHNCTAGAVLVRLLCTITGLNPGELIWSPSDIHIYLNQVESVKEQLKRTPHQYPILVVNKPKKNDISSFEFSDLKLLNYAPQARIKFEMNA